MYGIGIYNCITVCMQKDIGIHILIVLQFVGTLELHANLPVSYWSDTAYLNV